MELVAEKSGGTAGGDVGMLMSSTTISSSRTINNVLPKEILCRIFTSIWPRERVRLERVCRLWRWICISSTEYSPWRGEHKLVADFQMPSPNGDHNNGADVNICCVPDTQKKLEAALAFAERIGPWLCELEVHEFEGIDSMRFGEFYAQLAFHTPNLQYVRVYHGSITAAELPCIGQWTPNLTHLTIVLSHLTLYPSAANQFTTYHYFARLDVFSQLFRACSKLRCLRMYISDEMGGLLTELPAGLEELLLSLGVIIRDYRVLRQFLARAATKCAHLRMLTIEGCTNSNIAPELMKLKKNFQYFGNCPNSNAGSNISHLMQLGCFENIKCLQLHLLDGEILPLVSKHCLQLEFLAFNYFENVKAEQFVELGKLPRLKHLQFNARLSGPDSANKQEKLLSVLTAIAANGNGTLQSLSAITSSLQAYEAEALCIAIAALAREEEEAKQFGGGTVVHRRHWPIHVVLTNDVDNVCAFPRSSPFVCWHHKSERMEHVLREQMLRTICSPLV